MAVAILNTSITVFSSLANIVDFFVRIGNAIFRQIQGKALFEPHNRTLRARIEVLEGLSEELAIVEDEIKDAKSKERLKQLKAKIFIKAEEAKKYIESLENAGFFQSRVNVSKESLVIKNIASFADTIHAVDDEVKTFLRIRGYNV